MPISCATCYFWERVPTAGSPWGLCRAHAPVAMELGDRAATRFPRTNQSDWCGDHATPAETEE